jgi:hypothetical protein
MKDGKYLELETYNDYPDTVKNAAQRGIDLNAKVNNKCATSVGKIRAQQLANGRNISIQTIKRMYAYTSRAREFYNPDDTSACGTISYLLWGGDAANRWSAAKLKELGLFEGETAVSVGSSYAGQFGPGKKYKAPAQLSKEYNITLIACSSTKTEQAMAAKDLYQGSLFKKSLAYALKTTDPKDVYIMSAKYGLVELEEIIEPYDKTVKDMSPEERSSWAKLIYDKLDEIYEEIDNFKITILAGKAYYEPLLSLIKKYDLPLEGLRIGESMKELDEQIALELAGLDEDTRMEVILDIMLLQLA